MKRVLLAALLAAVLSMSFFGCMSIELEGSTDFAATPEPTAEVPELPLDTAVLPTEAPNANTGGSLEGLAAYYPWDIVPLPEGSVLVKAQGVEDTDKYVEYSYVQLTLTKSEAVEYFEPLMQKDADYYTRDNDLTFPSLEVQGMYPEVVSFTSLYARYTEDIGGNVALVSVNLYTPQDGETLLVAEIQVNYRVKP